jgi:hypothetical protein
MEGAWVSVAPFFVAFAITLFPIAFLEHTWIMFYQQIRTKRRQAYKDRKKKKNNTTLQKLYGGLDAVWWLPIVVYLLFVGLAVLGIVLFKHAGYDWTNALDASKEVPLILLGFWLVIILMSSWVVSFLRPTIDKSGATFIGVFGAWLLHLAVWISMVIEHWSGWFQLPLFFGITIVFIYTSLSFIRTNSRYVIIKKSDAKCEYVPVSFEAGSCNK